MLPYRDSRLTKALVALFFLVATLYAYYEIRGMLFGPRIEIPEGVSQVNERFVMLKGRADRIATLKMNGKPITVSEDGSFEEPYLLSEGLNRIVFDAEDKYGRDSNEVLEIVYTPSEASTQPSPLPAATTSASSTQTETETP